MKQYNEIWLLNQCKLISRKVPKNCDEQIATNRNANLCSFELTDSMTITIITITELTDSMTAHCIFFDKSFPKKTHIY